MADQRGASLVIALVLMLVLGVVLAAVLAFVNTNYRATEAYRQQRVQRYAGDAAMEAAINYVRGKATMGRDPNYSTSDPPCVYQVPTDAGTVTVSCKADAGSNSGVPNESGLVPNQAILATGQRHNEVGPMNQNQCYADILGIKVGQPGQAESSMYFNQGVVRDYFEESANPFNFCEERSRPLNNFAVRGKIVAAGRISGEGSLSAVPTLVGTTSVPSVIEAEYGCTMSVTPQCLTGNNVPDSDWADPGNGGTTTAWQNVPINWNALTTMGVTAPAIRNTGYHWDGSKLVATSGCTVRDTIILLPGVYTDANVLNRYTANPNCTESTIWLAPDPGADGILLTDDDKTSAFYFLFENGNTDWGCSNFSNLPHRWCIGGSASNNPRVVTGTPDGWNPLGVPGAVTPRTVTMNIAQTIDSGLSQSWFNAAGARTIGDGNYATYRPTFCIFGLCISTNRSIRLRDFAPQVAQGPDASNNKIYIRVAHREAISTDHPTVEVRAVSNASGSANCGYFDLPSNNTGSIRVDQITYGGSADAAASRVAQCLNGADLINGLQLTMRWTGNNLNSGYASGQPTIYLDGADVSFQSTPGASFPYAGSGGPAAIIDCDKTKAGAQLIFGSDSHVYVPDGSLEVCAGPYPTNPGDHQQIALWGVPAVPDLRPSSVSAGGGTQFPGNGNGSNARRIAEPGGRQDLNIRYSTNSTCGFCTITFEGTANMSYPGYSPPSGLAVDRVDARVTYNSNNACLLGICLIGAASQLRVGSCSIDAPRTSDMRSWDANVYGAGRTCFSTGQLASGLSATWAARAQRVCAFWICGSGSYTDQLDGAEFTITLRRSDANQHVLVPESGCITDYPNYWEGAGTFDCAIAKADNLNPGNIFSNEPDWQGRMSFLGTVYAPSAPLEIDETDGAYPLAGRGIVVRHLRVKGYRARPGYNLPVIDTQIDSTQRPREATFVACLNPAGTGAANECNVTSGNEDRILTKARVRFQATPGAPGGWQPEVIWWNDQR